MDALPIPQEVFGTNATQLLSAWYFDEGVVTEFQRGWTKDPAEWGEILAYLAKDLAGHFRLHGLEPGTTLGQIREAFEAEIRRT